MLHYNESGGDGKLALLFLHGLGTDADSWHYQFAFLPEKGYRLVAPDLPGFGRSSANDKGWTIQSCARQAADLMSELGITKYVVAGLSMGGTVGLTIALNYPERVRGLILINTFASLTPKSLSEWSYFTRRGLRAFLRKPSDQARIVAERVFPGDDKVFYRDVLVESIKNTNPKIYRRAMLELARFNVSSHLQDIHIPTLVISGEDDTTIPLSAQKEMASLLPSAAHVVISKAGHGVMVDQPDEFNSQVCQFLTQFQGNLAINSCNSVTGKLHKKSWQT